MAQATRDLAAMPNEPEGTGFAGEMKALYASEAQSRLREAADGREPQRNLTASDFVLRNAEGGAGTRTRIARDIATMTVADGMLQVIAAPFATAEALLFDGVLRLHGACDAARLARLERAARFVPQFGGLRSTGFGVSAGIADGHAVDAAAQRRGVRAPRGGRAMPVQRPPGTACDQSQGDDLVDGRVRRARALPGAAGHETEGGVRDTAVARTPWQGHLRFDPDGYPPRRL